MADPSLVQALVTVGFGALAGGLTNAVAIWMLFHPHEPKGVRGFALQGAIPKNRARLAKTIGRTVGERLLTPEDLAKQLSSPGLREGFHDTVRRLVDALLTTERGPLRAELPARLVGEIEQLVTGLGATLARQLATFAGTDDFRRPVGEFLARTAASVSDRPLSDLLTEARRRVIREQVEQWVTRAVDSDEIETAISGWLDRQVVRAAGDVTPMIERLPPGLVAAVERSVAGYLPVALERLAGVLRDPDARARIERALHQVFHRFLQNLMLHERIVARLVVTERTIARVLDNLGEDGTAQLAKLLDEPEMRDHIARSVNDAVVSFLRRPLSDHIASLGAERVDGLKHTAARYVVLVLRDEATRGYAIERLDAALVAAEQRTWGDLLGKLPPDRAATWIADALQTEQVQRWIAEGWADAIAALFDRPIGRPADRLPGDVVERITERVAPELWDWTQRHVPAVVARLDIQSMVEQKVLGFSLDRIEEIVRRTTQRELDVIVRLGFVLGAFVGGAAFLFSLLLP
ncbi:MAG TPA: DUF445 family protein [Gemmatimonadales bacterium]